MDPLAALADRQHGVFSVADAHRLGLGRGALEARTRSGRYERVGRQTYRIVGAAATWHQSVMRAVLDAGSGAAAARATALVLHDVGRDEGVIDIVVPRRRRIDRPDVRLHTATALPTEDVAIVEGIPATTIERTILDVAGDRHRHLIASIVDASIASGLTDAERLARFLDRRRRRGRPGVRTLQAVLELPHLGVPQSRYERALLDMLEAAGLGGVPQYDVFDATGRLLGRVDVAWPQHRVALEVDGHAFHSTRDQRRSDALRQNDLLVAGWNLLRCTSDQVFRADPAIVRTVARALGREIRPFLSGSAIR